MFIQCNYKICYSINCVSLTLKIFYSGTTILRLLVFPLVVVSQRHAVKMNNNMPQVQAYQQKMTDARLHGNPYESKLFIY